MTLHNLLIDKRIVQRNIEQGKLEAGEYQRFLDALPDLSDKLWRRPVASEEPRSEPAHTNTAGAAQGAARTEAAVQAGAQTASTAQTEPAQAPAAAPAVAPANADAVANAARTDAVPAFDASL
jgi:hypothetical protein